MFAMQPGRKELKAESPGSPTLTCVTHQSAHPRMGGGRLRRAFLFDRGGSLLLSAAEHQGSVESLREAQDIITFPQRQKGYRKSCILLPKVD